MKSICPKTYSLSAVFALLIAVLFCSASVAQDSQSMSFDILGGLNLTFDGQCEIEFDQESSKVSKLNVNNNVFLKIQSNNLELKCDLLLLNAEEEILIATGTSEKKVDVQAEEFDIACQRLEYHLGDNKFILTGKPVIKRKQGESTIDMSGKKIILVNKDGKIKMIIDKGSVDSSNPSDLASMNSGANNTAEETPEPTPTPTPEPTSEPEEDDSSKTPVVSE